MSDALLKRCHEALMRAAKAHPSPAGFELLLHPRLAAKVSKFEREAQLDPGSFATLAGFERVVLTLGAGSDFAVFCLMHFHRLDGPVEAVDGAADGPTASPGGTIVL
ncbi:hypothetical protein AB0O47_40170 [Streptomyces noursei]|uniref:hypothetical protein n=1 Tax=Streptomyces noursei TaxID=1971 RepID=UPI00344C0281